MSLSLLKPSDKKLETLRTRYIEHFKDTGGHLAVPTLDMVVFDSHQKRQLVRCPKHETILSPEENRANERDWTLADLTENLYARDMRHCIPVPTLNRIKEICHVGRRRCSGNYRSRH